MKNTANSGENFGKVIFYTDKGGKTGVEVQIDRETLWLSQKQIAVLFGTKRPAITKHLANIFKSGELREDSVCSILEHTAADSKTYKTAFYNLDAVISVGYRVNSNRATQFRIWATNILRRHLVDGYTINQKLLKAKEEKFLAFQRAIKLIETVRASKPLEYQEAMGLLDVIRDYSRALDEPDGSVFVAEPSVYGWEFEELLFGPGERRLEEYLLGLGQDLEGELYVLTSTTGTPLGSSGKVYRIVVE